MRSKKTIQHTKGKRQDIVDTVWAGCDVEEKHEVDAHLRDCENDQGDGDARLPNEVGARDKKGRNGEQDGEPKSDQVALDGFGDFCSRDALFTRRRVRAMEFPCADSGEAHFAIPIKYAPANIPQLK